ncbi:MAG TPA: acyl-ACP--UDP-N-acetylglucosamine O-acyltransferase [Pirellulales bacterium]|nr:acyl-ACP--UDP-N-acetylglucosamine O-acyltransferase [Pirellulales bacterium]
MAIHPLAVVHPTAQLGVDVEIGPFAIVEADVVLGDRCSLDAYVMVRQGTRLGPDNRVFERASLGGLPQHMRMSDECGTLAIGAANTIRENVTVHRALRAGSVTRIGSSNLLMVGSHVAHDCIVGDHTIIANNAMLAGHVTVDDRAYVSGGVGVHQFCRVGRLAMIGGLARVVKDVPPYVTIDGRSGYVVGLNTVGLRRAGYKADEIAGLKAAYRTIYRTGLTWNEILERMHTDYATGPAAAFAPFLAQSTRGVTAERRLPPGASVKMGVEAITDSPAFQAKVG